MNVIQSECIKCGRQMEVARLKCQGCDLAVDGAFELTPLARLSLSEQAFVTAFVRVRGHIKKMEKLFEISYPTVKNRLKDIANKLDESFSEPDDAFNILEKIERGELSVEEAIRLMP